MLAKDEERERRAWPSGMRSSRCYDGRGGGFGLGVPVISYASRPMLGISAGDGDGLLGMAKERG